MSHPALIGTASPSVHRAPEPARGADDPVTAPLPAVVEVDDHVHLHAEGDVMVVTLDGGLDDSLAATARPHLLHAAGAAPAVAVDLDQVTLLDASAVHSLVETLAGAGVDHCLTTTRLSGRMVLQRWLEGTDVAVFGSVADALQSRTFAESGYGSGWGDPADR